MILRPLLLAVALIVAVQPVAGCDRRPMLGQLEPRFKPKVLTREIEAVAARAAPGVLGVAVQDLTTGQVWAYNGDRPFPMQSVFKAPLGAAVLAEVEAGRLSLTETVTLTDTDLSPPFSPIADAWPQRTTYTVGELLEAASGRSDNTAADALLKRIGGPGALTAWLQGKHVAGLRVDRYERQLQPDSAGLGSFRAAWRGETTYMAAVNAVPEAQRRAAMAAYLKDPRDTATPVAAVRFLAALNGGELLSPASTRRLLDIMTRTPTGQDRLKAALPDGAALAHKTGGARTDLGRNPASNDIGIYTLKDGRKFAVAVFLTDSPRD
ncbi:MAG: serine hydrolase, partial [Caulobacter sp.]|nr:serine hydrolase [Caulobacter sp.]